ncbi:MAG: protein phosphatase 2C domain-containing protein [Bacteroidetes bacterium]|jgi:serine/threonine protein phosphatase PrpC|nr:protein phosphatase 2C domain-containing protein [Bacteroidota bacterium]
MKKYAIAGKSTQNRNKKFNGDYFNFTSINGFEILTLADGVGSRPCDYEASKLSCNLFIEKCEAVLKPDSPIEVFMTDAIADIDIHLSEMKGKCQGLLACFVAVIWPANKDYFYFVNLGDTRLYIYTQLNEIIQITKDEVEESVVRDKSGKVTFFSEGTIAKSLITNSLGIGNSHIKIESHKFSSTDMLILSSDGFYGCNHDAIELLIKNCTKYEDLQKGFDKTFSALNFNFKDDATVLMLRRNDFDMFSASSDQLKNQIPVLDQIPENLQLTFLIQQLEQNLIDQNSDNCLKLISIMNERALFPAQKTIDHLLNLYLKQRLTNNRIYNGLVEILLLSKK